jgi:ABC-type Mn2+/Zn2+ transport system ATPase subunit
VVERASRDVVVRELVRRAPHGRVVLDRLNATFEGGQVTVVHGANGSGKSMLARVLTGVDRPDAGSIDGPRAAAFLLPERAAVLPGTSARTLASALAPTVGAHGKAWSARLDDALDRLRSTHHGSTPMSQLSKGNLQKAYLAVGYALQPALAVLDEPMGGLDASAVTAAGTMLREMAADGRVVVITAHRPGRFADVNWELTGGRLSLSAVPPVDGAYLVDLAPVDRARQLITARRLGSGFADAGEPSVAGRVRVRVDAADLDALLRSALTNGLKINRVVEDGLW